MFDIRTFGAVGNGTTDDSAAIKKAIAACEAAGGGTVNVPAGTYLTGPIALSSHMNLHLESGSKLLFSDDFTKYPPVWTRWEGVDCYGLHPLVFANKATNVSITGRGTLDGQGKTWWDYLRQRRAEGRRDPETPQELELAKLNPTYKTQPGGGGGREMQFLRPPLVQFYDCENVLIEGVTVQFSPFWNVHPVYCKNTVIRGVTIINPGNSPNTDGLDVDSCSNMKIADCTFDVGDDCLVIKAGCGEEAMKMNRPTENIMVTNCLMYQGHGGVVIGSDTACGIKNVTVTNCVFIGTDRGIRLKTRRGRGGRIENLNFSNIIMEDVLCPIVMNMYYRPGFLPHEEGYFTLDPLPVEPATPAIKGLTISNLTVRRFTGSAGFLVGLPESPIEDVTISDCILEMATANLQSPDLSAMSKGLPSTEARGIRLRNVKGVSINRVRISPEAGSALNIETNVELAQ